ncbi:substrate-binding domain-containing protein [Vibrio sp. JC009]|uniref:substrate-binding domain-containing protein n=1 Tax=Vibrio sp. JC009 TaxID=2912314 RepID=UPI0023AF2815|nr:substrate-binding domain-containing protein [Vibrio sp. JC009]WED23612.1 substrate-binding domain-containing protein [Vibrio sp. JC009]
MKKQMVKQILRVLLWGLFSPVCLAAPLKVGISLVDLSNPFFSILAEKLSLSVKEKYDGEVEIYVQSSAYNLSKQIVQLEGFLQDDIDLIFIAASESKAIAPFINTARQKGVIVVAVDIESEGADISVTSDNHQAGFSACHYLAQHLKETGEVAIINGQPISSVINRVSGCKSAFEKFPGIKVVSATRNSSGTYSGGLESMTYLLLQYPELGGVFTINDPAALGALEAAVQSGNEKIKIVSVDGSPEFIESLKEGKQNLLASARQFPGLMAVRAVELAMQKLNGSAEDKAVELIPTRLVTTENKEQVEGWLK